LLEESVDRHCEKRWRERAKKSPKISFLRHVREPSNSGLEQYDLTERRGVPDVPSRGNCARRRKLCTHKYLFVVPSARSLHSVSERCLRRVPSHHDDDGSTTVTDADCSPSCVIDVFKYGEISRFTCTLVPLFGLWPLSLAAATKEVLSLPALS